MNSVVLSGRLVADPELRQTQSGISVTRFDLAVDRKYKKPDSKQTADFLHCVAYTKSAEFITKHFKKGKPIEVSGYIQTYTYNQSEAMRTGLQVVCESVSFCLTDKAEQAPALLTSDFTAIEAETDLPF